MNQVFKGLVFTLLLCVSVAKANEAPNTLREINLTAAAATAVIAGLQDKINTGAARPDDIDPNKLKAAYHAAYGRLASKDIASIQEAELRRIHEAMDRALDQVMTQFRADILKGGQDAFVPAFFRAQLLTRFNDLIGERYRAVVTNRRNELINGDSAPERVIENAEILKQINEWLERGHMQPEMRSASGTNFGFWPMTITEPCMVCHQRNGLQQRIGQFGGATVIISNR
ncbi:MAG: hypothetical protein ACKO9A_05610 [Alphaproteobacteria bacterium]